MNSDRRSDPPLNKSSLQGRRTTPPPPPPKQTFLDPQDKNPLDSASTRSEPPKPPGTHARKQRNKRDKLLIRSLKVFFFFFSPLGILAAVWTFLINGDDDKPTASPPAAVETTIAPETSSVATTESPSLEPATESIDADWERIARSVVLIYIPDCGGETWSGSGTIVLDGGYVLTNEHVSGSSPCEMEIYAIDSIKDSPVFISYAELIPNAFDQELDLSVIRLIDEAGRPTKAEGRTPIEIEQGEIDLGTSIKVLGFPEMGGVTISMTTGEHSGWWEGVDNDFGTGEFYKTSAKMGPGVSGGAAFEADTGRFIGIPTGGSGDRSEGDILGLVRPSRYALPLLEAAERAN